MIFLGACPVSPGPLAKEASPVQAFGIFVENQPTANVENYFWDPCTVGMSVCLSLFRYNAGLVYSGYAACFKVKSCEVSILSSLLWLFGIWELGWGFHITLILFSIALLRMPLGFSWRLHRIYRVLWEVCAF